MLSLESKRCSFVDRNAVFQCQYCDPQRKNGQGRNQTKKIGRNGVNCFHDRWQRKTKHKAGYCLVNFIQFGQDFLVFPGRVYRCFRRRFRRHDCGLYGLGVKPRKARDSKQREGNLFLDGDKLLCRRLRDLSKVWLLPCWTF